MTKIAELLSSDTFYPMIVALFILIYGGLKAKYFAFDKPKDAKKKQLVEIGEIAMKEVFDEYVRELKKGNADGKLTKEEIATANKMGVDKLKEKAKEKGLEIGKIIAEEYLPVFIDKIVTKLKGKKNG